MMPLAPSLAARNPKGHTEAEILAALQGRTGARRFSFRYEHLEADGTWIQDLTTVTAGTVSQNWLADIKRTCSFTMAERGGIDWGKDRIRPSVRLHLAPFGPEDWVEYPQGVFLLASPERVVGESRVVSREVTGYDQLLVYADELFTFRYAVTAGSNVVNAVRALLLDVQVPPSIRSVPYAGALVATKEWEPGTSKLAVINELLGMINYDSLAFDEDGVALVQPYRSPAERSPGYEYADDHNGLMFPQVTQGLDTYGVANQWVCCVSEPDQPPLLASYTNTDPASPTSTVRRGRTITDYRTEMEAVDITVLQEKVRRLAFEASQVYESLPFSTGLMPVHSGNDVYRVKLDALAVNATYAEHSWKLTMKAGAPMEHVARRVVTV
jgi:hypothetical protein